MSKDEFVDRLKAAARTRPNGQPPGEQAFWRETGLNRHQLRRAGIRSYGELCELAGVARNTFRGPAAADTVLEALANLARRLGRFPDHPDREVARHADPTFPGQAAFRTARAKRGPLEMQLLEWCRQRPEYAAVQAFAEAAVAKLPKHTESSSGRVVKGFVYLMRYGPGGHNYKIGKTDDVARRHSQLASMTPGDLRLVHRIETDDPGGIERYWLERFAEKRVKGEIFRLEPADVAAFKWRRYQ
jgi:hypothetical protein